MRTRILSGSKAPTARIPARRQDPVPAGADPSTLVARDLRARSDARAASDARARSDAPLVLGRYRLRRRLGTGGFATVWLAQDERLDRQVAVKILPRERVAGGRFEREARAAARLAHPGIVTLYEAAVDDEGAYLVSELVNGSTLDELLEAGRLSDRDVIRIGIALCDALAHAHANGVIHRDVKPSNVLVPERPTTPAGIARLTDFGVARVVGGDTLTRTGDVIGTEAYMAPEQAHGLPAGAPADLFSLALVLYEALSGTNPLRTTASDRRRAAHLPPLRRQRRELPRELGQAIDLALRPRPSERGSLAELRAALVASVGRAADEPGVVAAPWPTRTLARTEAPDPEPVAEIFDEAARPRPRRPDSPTAGRRTEAPPVPVPWPRRALAALATAGLAAWVLHHVPGAGAAPAALAVAIAALLVLALPRAGWVILATGAAAALILATRPGGALALLAGAAVPMLTAPLDALAWPLAIGAPALGAIGLAAAWPALAGLSRRAHRRAALAATGYVWAALATNGIGSTQSLPDALHHVLAPLATVGSLTTAGIWAAAAITLPLTRSRRWPALECLRLGMWATALALATLAAEHAAGAVHTSSVLLGAAVGAVVAFVIRRSGARSGGRSGGGVSRARSGNDRAPLA